MCLSSLGISTLLCDRHLWIQFIDIVFGSKLIRYIDCINFTLNGLVYDVHFDLHYFISVIFDRRDVILKMLLDPLPQLPSLSDKEQFIFAVVEHVDAAFFPGDQMEIREAINMTQLWSLLLVDGYFWRWYRNRYQVLSTSS